MPRPLLSSRRFICTLCSGAYRVSNDVPRDGDDGDIGDNPGVLLYDDPLELGVLGDDNLDGDIINLSRSPTLSGHCAGIVVLVVVGPIAMLLEWNCSTVSVVVVHNEFLMHVVTRSEIT